MHALRACMFAFLSALSERRTAPSDLNTRLVTTIRSLADERSSMLQDRDNADIGPLGMFIDVRAPLLASGIDVLEAYEAHLTGLQHS